MLYPMVPCGLGISHCSPGPERGGVLLITPVLLDLPQPYVKSVSSEAVKEEEEQ